MEIMCLSAGTVHDGSYFSFSAQTGTQSGSLSHDISVRVVETKGRFFHQELEKRK